MSDKKQEENVSVSKTQLEALVQDNKKMSSRLEALEAKNKPTFAKKNNESFCRMRKYNDKYVVEDLKNVRDKIIINKLDEKEKVVVCDVVISDGKSEPETIKAVNYNEFIENAERVEVEIVKVDKKEEVRYANPNNPIVDKRVYNEKEGSIGMKKVGEVENVIVIPETKVTVKLPDGQLIKLSNNALNI